jgi:hypothetical protein
MLVKAKEGLSLSSLPLTHHDICQWVNEWLLNGQLSLSSSPIVYASWGIAYCVIIADQQKQQHNYLVLRALSMGASLSKYIIVT